MADDAPGCAFSPAYRPRCGAPVAEGSRFCAEHEGRFCASCGSPTATRECDYIGKFVCGAPLCDGCEGWQDTAKPSGAWGFLNHTHRPKRRVAETIRLAPARREGR